MAVRDDFAPGEVLAAADLNDTFASKLDLAGGKILQIVRATDSTNRSTTSTSFVDVTGMSVTVTPQKDNSAIILLASYNYDSFGSIDTQTVAFQITDNSNNAVSGAQSANNKIQNYTGSSLREAGGPNVLIGYSTPATTSAVTYKLRFLVGNASVTGRALNASHTGQMYAIEVSA
jgi:hypothetical protein